MSSPSANTKHHIKYTKLSNSAIATNNIQYDILNDIQLNKSFLLVHLPSGDNTPRFRVYLPDATAVHSSKLWIFIIDTFQHL